jgi:hypothetical protein
MLFLSARRKRDYTDGQGPEGPEGPEHGRAGTGHGRAGTGARTGRDRGDT